MTSREIRYHISRLVADCQIFRVGRVYQLRSPSRYNRLLSETIYQEVYEDFTYEASHSLDSLSSWLFIEGLWTGEHEEKLKIMKDDLDKLKVELYKSNKPIIRKAIEQGKIRIAKELAKKHQYDRLTSEYQANEARERFLIGCGIYQDGRKYWKKPLEDWKKPDSIIDYIYTNRASLSEEQIRAIAKSPEWKSFHIPGRLIDRPIVDMSDELKDLIGWGEFYRSLYKHPECPIDAVIEDDDRLDGWLILNRQNSRKRALEAKRDQLVSKHNGAGEIYVIPREVDDDSEFSYEEIIGMNDENSLKIMKERQKVIKEKGEAVDTDFVDVKMRIISDYSHR